MKVTRIEWEAGLLRRVLLFQSLRQFASFAFFLLVALAVARALLYVAGSHLGLDSIALPALAGALYPVYLVLPERFFVEAQALPLLAAQLDAELVFLGYRRRRDMPGVVYASRLPRWLSWEENRIRLVDEPGRIKVVAPRLVAKRIQARVDAL